MTSIAIFAISGTALVVLVVAKAIEGKLRKRTFIFSWIARWDELARFWYHRILHLYSEGKGRLSFYATKQFKLRARNIFNKTAAYLKEKREQYENNMRNSRLLKKPDGISEFFKSISEVEKGNGTIEETLEDSQKAQNKLD